MSRRRLALLVITLLAVVVFVSPPQPLVYVGPQQIVNTNNPKAGVHTRLTDEVEEWKIQRSLQMVREMGAPWVVEYFPWAYSEPRRGVYDFRHADTVVNHARAQGLTVIARIDLVPDWARPINTPSQLLGGERFADYASFVAEFARHFRGRVQYIQIWNEPNLTNEWGGRAPDPAAYTRLLKLAYRRIKEANPDAVVLAGALSPTLESDGVRAMDDLHYLLAMYAEGARDSFDALAIHAYGRKSPADEPPAIAAINFRRAELLRDIMVQNGDEDKAAFVTEGGWNDHPRWAYAVSPSQRVQYTLDAYQIALRDWAWCRMFAPWAFRFPAEQHSVQDYFSFVTPQFLPKPIYDAVKRANTGAP
ncbi:MAG: beta-galactosidase [Chloroflexi bacterium]|nr:beta-galactosidase [Chloroflexota bacterium]